MKTRILVGAGGGVLVLLALYVFPPIIMEILMAALCVLATYELLAATKLVRNHLLQILSMLISLLTAAAHDPRMPFATENLLASLVMLLVIGGFLILLRFHEKMDVDEVLAAFFGALVVPYLLLALLRIFQMENGSLLVLLPLLAAWGADTFAYFSGMLFGKRKLAPVISPKKTIAGAVGGVIGGTVLVTIATLIFDATIDLAVPLWAAALLGAFGAIFGEIGDLSFSVIKRQVGIKDYGKAFPGHGGVLDRFDSVIFVAPLAELVLRAFS